MSQFARLLLVLFLAAGVAAAVSSAEGISPVEEAAAAGVPLLAEFTLRPGDPPYEHRYTATTDGPHLMVAAWGASAGIRMAVHGIQRVPPLGEGNPARVAFDAVRGTEYRVVVGAAGDLRVAAVGLLYGGPRRAVAPPGPAPATPIPIPGPEPAGATPIPIPGPVLAGVTPIPIPKAIPTAVLARLTAPLDRSAALAAVAAHPALSTLLSSPPGGLPAGSARAPARPTVPASAADLDWRAGLAFRPWAPCPSYAVGGRTYPVAALAVSNTSIPAYDPLAAEQARGVVRLATDPPSHVLVALELPPEPATYLVTARVTDADGRVDPTWVSGVAPVLQMHCLRAWMAPADQVVPLPLVGTAPLTAFATLLAVAPQDAPGADATAAALGMRRVHVLLGLRTSRGPVDGDPKPPLLFGGFDVLRLP